MEVIWLWVLGAGKPKVVGPCPMKAFLQWLNITDVTWWKCRGRV